MLNDIFDFNFFKILGVPIENIQSIKKSASDVTRGNIYAISIPDSLANKYSEPQTRLWYYDKRNYQIDQRPLSADYQDFQRPTLKLYSINKTMPEEELVRMDDAFTKTPTLMPETVEPPPQPLPPPSTVDTTTTTQNESLPPITQRITTPNKVSFRLNYFNRILSFKLNVHINKGWSSNIFRPSSSLASNHFQFTV